jgi:hypothetical protein
MNEAHIDLTAQDSSRDAVAEVPDDRLLTTRLPPITPPPLRPASVPPSSPPPSMAPSMPGGLAPSGTYRSNASMPAQLGSSWWRALLTATFPPPARVPAVTDERVIRRRVGATCAGMALGFVILALALGLRGVEPAYSPTVSAALVLARAIVALGFLGFGYGLLRMAERVFTGRTEGSSASPSDLG